MNKTRKIEVTIIIILLSTAISLVAAQAIISINLGTTTVIKPEPTVPNLVILSATYNSLTGTISSDKQTATFANSQITLGGTNSNPTPTTATCIVIIKNIGEQSRTLPINPTVSGTGVGDSTQVLTFTPTPAFGTVTINGGESATFTWTVTANHAGTATPVISIAK